MKFMEYAFEQAKMAYEKGEVPVGAVVVKDMKIISSAHNLTETDNDPTAHAEIVAIKKACQVLGTTRLTGCDLYVTLEPCAMCVGAIVNARIRELYIGAMDKKAGCCGTAMELMGAKHFNHSPKVYYGIMEDECSKILTDFFKERR